MTFEYIISDNALLTEKSLTPMFASRKRRADEGVDKWGGWVYNGKVSDYGLFAPGQRQHLKQARRLLHEQPPPEPQAGAQTQSPDTDQGLHQPPSLIRLTLFSSATGQCQVGSTALEPFIWLGGFDLMTILPALGG